MNLTAVPKEGRREVLSLLLDGEPWREIHISIFGRAPSFNFQSEEGFLTFELNRVKLYVARRLSSRSYSTFELRKLLEEKLVPASVIESTLHEFQHYLDDGARIEAFIASQLRKKAGPKAIAMKLRSKGVPEEAYAALLQRMAAPDTQKEQILKLLATRYKNLDLNQWKDQQKAMGALMRKGFDFEAIRDVLEVAKK